MDYYPDPPNASDPERPPDATPPDDLEARASRDVPSLIGDRHPEVDEEQAELAAPSDAPPADPDAPTPPEPEMPHSHPWAVGPAADEPPAQVSPQQPVIPPLVQPPAAARSPWEPSPADPPAVPPSPGSAFGSRLPWESPSAADTTADSTLPFPPPKEPSSDTPPPSTPTARSSSPWITDEPAVPATTRRPLYEYPIYDEPKTPALPPAATGPTRRRRWPMAVASLLSALVGGGVVVSALWLGGTFDSDPVTVTTTPTGSTVVQRITEIVDPNGSVDGVAIAVGRKVVPSIVTVEVGAVGGTEFQPFASGSGVVLTADGLIITNNHVIEDAEALRVVFQDGRMYPALLVGTDSITDLAVIEIEADNLVAIDIGSTGDLQIGETTIAVGNPLGLDGGASLTVGVLSAFNRRVDLGIDEQLFGMLQTDAPITQGSSGGALVDSQGRLIGITTAIGVSSAGAEGIGFATPVELVTRITDEIIETGRVRHAFLGVNGESYIEEGPDGVMRPAGALVAGFVGDPSAAENAGLEVGDRIVSVNGDEIRTMQDLIIALRLFRVGDVIIFDIERGDELISADVTLGERPEGV